MPALEENTTNGDQSKKKRVQLKHLLLDCDFFDKPKIVALQYRFTPLGVGALIHILCAMSKGTNGEIPLDCALAILDRHGVPEKDKFIPYCLGLGILHAGSSELFISNCRVVEDQESLAEKQDRWKKKKRQQRDNEGTLPESLNTELLNTEDLNKEEGGVGEETTAPPKLKLHPSPKAPKHLKRKTEELLPFPDDESPVFLTQTETRKLIARFKNKGAQDPEYEMEKLVNQLDLYSANKKFYNYVDHYRTLWNWANRDEAKQRAND